MMKRCGWVTVDRIYIDYHDMEWGVPVHDDRLLFEFLILEGMQAGLSWITILKKRENFRKAFDHFDPEIIAEYSEKKIQRLLTDAGIIRNRLKLESTVTNARAFLKLVEEFESFDAYVWQFVGGKPKKNKWKTLQQVPVTTHEAETMSRDLKKRGFRFVGPTICYSFMQAVGMVNDHLVDCFRYNDITPL